jgi:hypothetical protein
LLRIRRRTTAIGGTITVMTDITEQKQAELALAAMRSQGDAHGETKILRLRTRLASPNAMTPHPLLHHPSLAQDDEASEVGAKGNGSEFRAPAVSRIQS